MKKLSTSMVKIFGLGVGAVAVLSACQSQPYEPKVPTVIAMQSADRLTFPDEVSSMQTYHYARLNEMVRDLHPAAAKDANVTLTTHDARYVNRARLAAVAEALAGMGIEEVNFQHNARVPHRTVEVQMQLNEAIAPACPDWRGPGGMNFTNQPLTNFGCATTTNLSRMVENPNDLLGREGFEPADAQRAAAAVRFYRETPANRLEIVGGGNAAGAAPTGGEN